MAAGSYAEDGRPVRCHYRSPETLQWRVLASLPQHCRGHDEQNAGNAQHLPERRATSRSRRPQCSGLRLRRGIHAAEKWNIGTGGEVDPQFGAAMVVVVLCQALANFIRLHPDDRVSRRIVSQLATEQTDSEGPLLQVVLMACQSLFHHEAQEFTAPLARAEG